eukprot:359787-Chlamydomonas_euryale.AAC.1
MSPFQGPGSTAVVLGLRVGSAWRWAQCPPAPRRLSWGCVSVVPGDGCNGPRLHGGCLGVACR